MGVYGRAGWAHAEGACRARAWAHTRAPLRTLQRAAVAAGASSAGCARAQRLPFAAAHGLIHEPGTNASASSRNQDRFVFLDLIATGGFSAVFKAYDLLRHDFVACELHHSKEWDELRKEAFVRHVEREIDITVGQHRRVVGRSPPSGSASPRSSRCAPAGAPASPTHAPPHPLLCPSSPQHTPTSPLLAPSLSPCSPPPPPLLTPPRRMCR